MSDAPKADWSSTTWEGSRRAQLRAALESRAAAPEAPPEEYQP